MGSTILHRYPVITTDIPEWEQDMMDLQDRNQERRLKHFYDLVGGTDAQFIPDTYPANYEEIIESMPFKPASRITEADNTNDRRSTERRLQDSLYLIGKEIVLSIRGNFHKGRFKVKRI